MGFGLLGLRSLGLTVGGAGVAELWLGLEPWLGSTRVGGGAVLRLGRGGASTVRKGRPKVKAQLSGLESSLSIVRETRACLGGKFMRVRTF